MKKIILAAVLGLIGLAWGADYTSVGLNNSAQVINVSSSAVVTVIVSADAYEIVHLGVTDDSGTASAAGARIVVMNTVDAAGTAVTMNTTFAAGKKTVIFAGGSSPLSGEDVPKDSGGLRVIQIKGTEACRVLIIRHQ